MFYAEFGRNFWSEDMLRTGWSGPEEYLVWSDGRHSVVVLPIYCPKTFNLSISFDSYSSLDKVASFYLCVNTLCMGVFNYGPGQHQILLENVAPPEELAGSVNVEFFHINPIQPAMNTGNDFRLINIALRNIFLKPLELSVQQIQGELATYDNFSDFNRKSIIRIFKRETEIKNILNNDQNQFSIVRSIGFYLYGLGGNKHDRLAILKSIREKSPDLSDRNLHEQSELVKDILSITAPTLVDFVNEEIEPADFCVTSTLPSIENALYDAEFSQLWLGKIGSFFQSEILPAEYIVSASNSDLIIGPRLFAVYDQIRRAFYRGVNPAGLSLLSINLKTIVTENHLVVIQDQFYCGNIAHFLFDSCIRTFQFCQFKPAEARNALFILGGIPSGFHKLLITALTKLFSLSEDQFLFPVETIRIRSSCSVSWFSDQVRDAHPFQRGRPEAVSAL